MEGVLFSTSVSSPPQEKGGICLHLEGTMEAYSPIGADLDLPVYMGLLYLINMWARIWIERNPTQNPIRTP